jgi:hypothetical protein
LAKTIRQIKRQVRDLVERNDIEGLRAMLQDSQRVLSALFSMTYDKSSLVAWKAIKAYGLLLVTLADKRPEKATEQVKRLLWSITEESGGLGWAAIEILTEAVCNSNGKMNGLVPLLIQYAEEPPFVPSVLYALRRLTECLGRLPWPEEEIKGLIEEAQALDVPEVRGHLVLVYAKIKDLMELQPLKDEVLTDERPFVYFDGENMVRTTPKELAEKLGLV